jgi:hypothetical protein
MRRCGVDDYANLAKHVVARMSEDERAVMREARPADLPTMFSFVVTKYGPEIGVTLRTQERRAAASKACADLWQNT